MKYIYNDITPTRCPHPYCEGKMLQVEDNLWQCNLCGADVEVIKPKMSCSDCAHYRKGAGKRRVCLLQSIDCINSIDKPNFLDRDNYVKIAQVQELRKLLASTEEVNEEV